MYKFLLMIIVGCIWSQSGIDVTVDRNRIYKGESINLTISVENGESPEVNLSTIKDFIISSEPSTSTNIQWINGKMSTTHSLTWTLKPKRKGKLHIPSLKVKIDEKSFQSKPIIINVLDRNTTQNGGKKDLEQQYYVEASVDNLQPYRGEQIILTYTLYTKINLASFDIGDLPRMKGFWSQDLYTPRNLQFREVTIDRNRWYAATVKEVALFPTKSGTLTIQPATVIVGIKSGQKRKSLDFFSDPFFTRSKQVTLSSNTLDIKVKSLPTNKGKISAAVGEWNISSKIDRISVKENEAVTMSIIIYGTGNLKSVDVNDIFFPLGLETFEPKIKIEESPFRDKLGGKKIIEYVLIPRKRGKIIIPAIELTYFDLSKEQWETKRSNSIRLNVIQNEKSISTAIGFSKEEVALVGKDIRFTNMDSPDWQRRSVVLVNTTSVVLFAIAIFIFLLPTTINLRKIHLDSTSKYRIAKSALKNSLIEIKNISTETPELIYEKIHSSINIFISKKLNKTIERSGKEIIEICYIQGVKESLIKELSVILKHADTVRYAPVPKVDANDDLKTFKELILNIDRHWI